MLLKIGNVDGIIFFYYFIILKKGLFFNIINYFILNQDQIK